MLAKNANEIKRTYFVTNPKNGMKFFKLYTPSEAQKAFKKNGWKGKIVGKLEAKVEKSAKITRMPANYIQDSKWVKKYDDRKVDTIHLSDFTRV